MRSIDPCWYAVCVLLSRRVHARQMDACRHSVCHAEEGAADEPLLQKAQVCLRCILLHMVACTVLCLSEQMSRNEYFAVFQWHHLGSHAAVTIRALAEEPAHRGFRCSNDAANTGLGRSQNCKSKSVPSWRIEILHFTIGSFQVKEVLIRKDCATTTKALTGPCLQLVSS